uniref:Uncharacterized protein n=1 Tax=Anguilla anguilla TaxID=7936 RepID=A0A0E9ULN6_ANGAN
MKSKIKSYQYNYSDTGLILSVICFPMTN